MRPLGFTLQRLVRHPPRPLGYAPPLVLTGVSFVLPLALWCLVSYVDWIWHPDIKLQISSEREGSSTVFTAGDHISPTYYEEMLVATRADNAQILAGRTQTPPITILQTR
jgi:NitT/TauT family transport system permease protein